MIYFCWAGNFILLQQTIASNPYGLEASNTLSFAQTIDVSPRIFKLKSTLFLGGNVTLAGGSTWKLPASNSLLLKSSAFKTNPQVAGNLLSLYHTAAYASSRDGAKSVLALGQSTAVEVQKPTTSVLVFSGKVSCKYVGINTAASALSLVGGATCYKSNVINARFIGIYIPPPAPNLGGGDNGHCP